MKRVWALPGSLRDPSHPTWNPQRPFLTPSAMPNKSKRSGNCRYTDMTDDLKDTTTTEAVAEDWAKVKLPPRLTGLPMAVWITEDDAIRTMRGSKSALFMAVAAPGAPLRR
jgi:hypothetical protein